MRLLPLLFALTLVAAACDSIRDGPPEGVGLFEATLTGEVEATLVGSAGALPTAGGEGVTIQLLPGGRAGGNLGFVGPFGAAGTYAVGEVADGAAGATYRDGQRFLFGTSGTVVITSADPRALQGTFDVSYVAEPRAGAPVVLRAEGAFEARRY